MQWRERNIPTTVAAQAASLIAPDIAFLFEEPKPIEDLEFDASGIEIGDPQGSASGSSSELLPGDYSWRNAANNKIRIPLRLCEFLAYKSSLAYAPKLNFADNLKSYPGVEEISFFDTKRDPRARVPDTPEARALAAAKALTDTQGFGFVYQKKIWIVLRGSESDLDWKTDLDIALTNDFLDAPPDSKKINAKRAVLMPLLRSAERDCGRRRLPRAGGGRDREPSDHRP